MDPKAFQIAMDQVNRMTPEQLAQMQQQAQNMNPEMAQHAMRQMQNMSADDWRRFQEAASNMTPQQMAEKSQNAAGQFQAQQKYMQQGAVALKEEGNALHKLGNFSSAADKYEQALGRLNDLVNSSEVADLRKACRLNLASCYLKLEKNQECVHICDDILQVDRENMKALYRRGQALGNLGRYSAATTDLKHAKRLVGNDAQQLTLIQQKLDLFENKIQQDFIVEEIDETPQKQYQNFSSQDNQPIIQDAAQFNENQQQNQSLNQNFNQNFNFQANQDQILQAAMQMKDDPKAFEKFQEMLANQSDEEIEAQLKAYGLSNPSQEMVNQVKSQAGNFSSEQFSDAVEKMQNMPPDQLKKVMEGYKAVNQQSSSSGSQGDNGLSKMIDMMSQNPELMKKMTESVSKMPPEQLAKMQQAASSANTSQSTSPLKADSGMLLMAQKMMSNMSPQDMEKMREFATLQGGQSDPMSMMKNPGMVDSAMNMMKNMKEEDLVKVFQQMSPNMSDDVARASAKQVKNISPGQMKAIMFAQSAFDKVNSARKAVLSRTGMIITLLVLLAAVLLRYLGIL